MTSFKTLLQESKKTYSYRLKSVVPLNTERLDDLERFLGRYDLLDFGHPEQLDPKHDSLEFRDLDNAQVFRLDFVIGVPVSAYILQQEIRAALNVPEKFVVVRADNEPVEVEGNRQAMLRDLDQMAAKSGLTQKASLLSTDRFYYEEENPQVKDAFGDRYNQQFLQILANVAASRKPQIFTTDDRTVSNDTPSLRKSAGQEPMQDMADFNDKKPGVKPVYKAVAGAKDPIDPVFLAPDANFDDDTKEYMTPRVDRKGKIVVNTIKTKALRKEALGAKK